MRLAVRFWPILVVVLACGRVDGNVTATTLGAPLPELSASERADFMAGRALFERAFTEAEGLGPSSNEQRCSSCHDVPTVGGMGAETALKATRFAGGRCDLLREYGGDLLQQQITDTLRTLGFQPERIPATATAAVEMIPPALYGAGLIEAMPDADILRQADPDDADGDGISGRPGRASDGRVGRFGRKANFATLPGFIANAFLGEMGLTSAAHPQEETLGGVALPAGTDPVPDPEIGEGTIELVARYVRLLAAPAPEAPASRAARDSIRTGERLFRRAGCARCHTPALTTRSAVPALHDREVRLYSDLLLHDLGPERATVCTPDTGPSEWRTPVLMGLRHRHKFLHDGRAQNVRAAIEAHGGEAERSRDSFLRLTPPEQERLLRFLYSL